MIFTTKIFQPFRQIRKYDDLDKLDIIDKILPWFKENYERTNDKEFIKIKEIYDNFATSNFFIIYQKKKKENITKLFSMNTLKQIYF